MGLYVYCIGRPSHPAPRDTAGLDGAPVREQEVAGFSVWVSELVAPPRPSLDAVRAHNAVVEAACETETPLPLRFGQWFESRAGLETNLAGRRDELTDRLERVAGALEHGVRILDPGHEPAPQERGSGTAYMESLARRARKEQLGHSRGRDAAVALQEWLGPMVRDARVRPAGAGTIAVAAFLVDRHDTRSYAERVRQFPPERPDLQFVFSGPWPPYGFVE